MIILNHPPTLVKIAVLNAVAAWANVILFFETPPPALSTLQIWLNFLAPILSTIVTTVLAVIVARMTRKQEVASIKQEESNQRQEGHLIEIQKFTNSALGMSMKVAATALRRVADITGKDEDIKVADQAAATAAAHEAAQKVVDAQNLVDAKNKQSQ
jgi:hypothetical protein